MLILLPSINSALALKSEVDANGVKAQVVKDKVIALRGQDQAKLTAELAKTEAALPSDKDAARFLATLSELAVTSGASVDNAQLVTTGTSRGSEKNALDFQVIIRGPFAAVKGFLTNIETTRTVMAVKSMTINLGEAGKLTADLSITGYYEPLTTGVTAIDLPLPDRTAEHEKVLAELDRRTIYVAPTPTPSVSGRSDPFSK
jgi:hypothetical protein